MSYSYFKRSEMWAEAFRICKQFAPQMFTKLNEEYSMLQSMRETLSKDPTEIIEHAKELERQGDYRKAIERYLQLNPTILDKDDILAKCWIRAAELAAKFLPKDQGMFVMKELAPMLENIKHHIDAAALYLQTGMFKEALNSMISGQHWPEAIRLSKEMGPE
jgi:intraflagellar transport protein 172